MAEETARKEVTAVLVNWEKYPNGLPRRPAETLKSLSQTIGDLIDARGDDCPRELLEIQACLERFDAFLFQSARLREYLDLERFFSFPIPIGAPDIPTVSTLRDLPAGSSMAIAAADACTDFESLLFQGRALLDRFALCVSRHHGADADRFSRLEKRLAKYAQCDRRAKRLSEILKPAGDLVGPLTDPDDKRSLRSLLAHRSSFEEGTRVLFWVTHVAAGRFLVFDCEVHGYPVFTTFREIFKLVSFILVNGLLIYTCDDEPLSLPQFEPDWKVPFVKLSDYVRESGPGDKVQIGVRFIPNGVRTRWVRLDRSIYDSAIVLPAPSTPTSES